MHELSIALAIVDAAVEESDRRGGARVTQVHLKLGQLAGVVQSALLASYEMAAEMSGVAGSRLIIEEVPIVAFCPKCGVDRQVVSPQQICCNQCGTPTPNIVTGRELEVVAMEIVEQGRDLDEITN
ncbi:MAG: hydrogenase maturation nickel metallochaperone HypA [Tepidisphaeraceae bacterium]|jgi:hydrogenase nickel incorporation protein HypA/HybF